MGTLALIWRGGGILGGLEGSEENRENERRGREHKRRGFCMEALQTDFEVLIL